MPCRLDNVANVSSLRAMSISFIETDGGKLAVEVTGAGPLVICSPGLGDTRDAFALLAAHLVAGGYRVARIDLRGHGDSSAHFDRYGDEATAADFLTVTEALGGGPAILVGASLSAGAAVIAAGRRPDLVAGLILLGPFVRNGIGKAMRWLLYAALARPWGPSIWRTQAAKLWPGLSDQAIHRAASTTALLTRPGRWAAFRTTSITDHDVVAPWIGRVKSPVIVIMGEADPDWKDPQAEAKWVASNFAGAEMVMVPGAGHAPMLERPDVVNLAISRFLLKEVSSGAHKAIDA